MRGTQGRERLLARLPSSPVTVTVTVWLAATVVVLHATKLTPLVLLKHVARSYPPLPLGNDVSPDSTA